MSVAYLLLRCIVDHEDICDDLAVCIHKGLVIGVGQVDVSSLLIIKGQDETMGNVFVESLRAVIRTPFEVLHFRNLILQRCEVFDECFDLCGCGVITVFKGHYMSQGTIVLGESFIHGKKGDAANKEDLSNSFHGGMFCRKIIPDCEMSDLKLRL